MKFFGGLFLSLALFSCVVEDESAAGSSGSSSSGLTAGTFTEYNQNATIDTSYNKVLYINLTDGTWSVDNATFTEIQKSKAYPFGENDNSAIIEYTKDDDKNSTGLIKIDVQSSSEDMAFYLSGTSETGGVKIQSNGTNKIALYLNDATMTSSNYPCVDITKGSDSIVNISGTNTFADGRAFGYGFGDSAATCDSSRVGNAEGSDSKGTLYCKGGMTICGSGSLSVTQAYKNCIASKDGVLKIENGSLSLTSKGKNGLFGGQAVVVQDGTISITTTGEISTSSTPAVYRKANGIKTDDDDYPESYVSIEGGSVTVSANYGKAINAPIVKLLGGENSFSSAGTAQGASRMMAPPAFFMDAPPPPPDGDFPPMFSRAGGPGGSGGMPGGNQGDTQGGNAGGSSSSATYTYYDADGVLQSGTITFAPEGIEGASAITISGGTHTVSGGDDGINVSNTGGTLAISGGTLFVKASGDGLDSNGNITISGGKVVVSQTGGGNSPIDAGDNYTFTVTGTDATVFALGSKDMFDESIPSSSSIPWISSTSLTSGTSSLGVNEIIAIKDPQSYNAAILISPSLTSGQPCSFVQGGTISGETEIFDGVYFPASVTGGTETSETATTTRTSSNGARPNRVFNRRGL